jgi:hypothetical protein
MSITSPGLSSTRRTIPYFVRTGVPKQINLTMIPAGRARDSPSRTLGLVLSDRSSRPAFNRRLVAPKRRGHTRKPGSLPILRINVAPSKLLQRRISGVEPNAVRYFIAIVAFADDAAESAMLAKLVPAAEIH